MLLGLERFLFRDLHLVRENSQVTQSARELADIPPRFISAGPVKAPCEETRKEMSSTERLAGAARSWPPET
jgi:hypothetical protein